MSLPRPATRTRLILGADGAWASPDGRWRITRQDARRWTLTDTSQLAQFGYLPGTWAIPVTGPHAGRAFINGYLAGLYRSPADPYNP